jgi:hypothetical protein
MSSDTVPCSPVRTATSVDAFGMVPLREMHAGPRCTSRQLGNLDAKLPTAARPTTQAERISAVFQRRRKSILSLKCPVKKKNRVG